MSHPNGSKQQPSFGCGQNGCGQNGSLCPTCEKSFMASTEMKCPDGNPRCSDENPCDFCKATKHSLVEKRGGAVGGGKASDMVPLQAVHGSSNQEQCDECKQPLGSNTQACGICASFAESPLNPEQPNIQYHPEFGPMKDSFGPCTLEITRRTLENFQMSFDASKKNGFPFTRITCFKRGASLLRSLLSQRVTLGIEGFNNSCFVVDALWMLSQGNMHERINIDCLSGYILYKILWDLRCGLFVGRDIVEAFRLSLQEYPVFQRTIEENGMDDPFMLLWILEEVEILRKGPILSETGCVSFHIHEVRGENPAPSIQEALCASVSSHSHVPENGSITSFQFCQQRGNGGFTGQTLGTHFDFPHNCVIMAGKLLDVRMFIIYDSQHYLVVLCVGGAFFLSNSLSAFICGHFLPEMREISEAEAMELFRTQAHTIVFECVGNVPPPPVSCASGPWFSPPPPLPHCAQSGWFLPPPPTQASCAQVAWVHQSPLPPVCGAQVAPTLPPPPPVASCAQVARVHPPPQPASSEQSAQAIQSQQPLSVNIKIADVKHYKNDSMMTRWSVSICHPTKGQITLSGGYSESMNQCHVINYTFDSDNSNPKRLFKYDRYDQCNRFIDELNRQLNS